MGLFFIDTETGQVATQGQLLAAGVATGLTAPPKPWYEIRASRDATTLWHAVMRKRTRGVYIGTLCIRHSDHHASLLADGWEEVAPADIGLTDARSDLADTPDGLSGWGGHGPG